MINLSSIQNRIAIGLHAGTVCETWQRNRLERLCR